MRLYQFQSFAITSVPALDIILEICHLAGAERPKGWHFMTVWRENETDNEASLFSFGVFFILVNEFPISLTENSNCSTDQASPARTRLNKETMIIGS